MSRMPFRPDFEKYWMLFIFAVLPAAAALYGWRTVSVCAAAALAGHLAALFGGRLRGASAPVRGSLVWAMLPLALPPSIPWWLAVSGAVFGEVVARQLFGGYGRNLVNPLALAVVFLGTGYPGVLEHAGMMPGAGPTAGLASWTSSGAACPATAQNTAFSNIFFSNMPVLPGEASTLLLVVGLVVLRQARALDARWPLGALLGLGVAAGTASFLRPDVVIMGNETLPGDGFLLAIAAAGLDVYSLPRTPAMRLPGGIAFGILYVLLRPAGGVIPTAFAALLLANVLTPLGDTFVVSRRARRWIVSGEQAA